MTDPGDPGRLTGYNARMQMTPDGYLQPLPLNPVPLGIGGLIVAAGIGAAVSGWAILGVPLVLLGLLWAGNAWGKRRVRVTRSKLLIEDDPLVRGFLIGPHRSRVAWDETESVGVAGDHVRLVAKGGAVTELAKGASAADLEKLLQRIQITMDLYRDDRGSP